MSKYTNEEIASDFTLWMEYVDTTGIDSKEDFEAMSMEEKLTIISAIQSE